MYVVSMCYNDLGQVLVWKGLDWLCKQNLRFAFLGTFAGRTVYSPGE